MSFDPRALLPKISGSALGAGMGIYALAAFWRRRAPRFVDALNAGLCFDGVYASGKLLFRCGWDQDFRPGDDLVTYLIIGALAIVWVSLGSLADLYKTRLVGSGRS